MRVSVDDQISELMMDPAMKLGDFVQGVVSSLPESRIITGITVDGMNLQRYAADTNGTGAVAFPDGEAKEIQIRTADQRVWAVNGLDMALQTVERIQKSLLRAAELFREREKGEANHFFVHCIEGMERFIEMIMITRVALRLDFARIEVFENISLAQVQNELSVILKTILECQEKEDFVGVADKVEYELLTNLHAWAKALRQLRISSMSNA